MTKVRLMGVSGARAVETGGKEEVHLDSKCGMALSWGPYLAALSYSSNNGMARSFIFLGTARTLRSGI